MHKEGYSMLSHFNPKACVCQNYCLYTSENELLANCVPEILQRIILQYPNGEVKCTKIAIEFNFQKDGVVSKVQHTLDIKELDKLKLVEVCSDLYTISDKKFISYIKLLIPKAPTVNKYFIESLGWTRINGHNVFCVGDRLIGNTDNIEYEVDPYLSKIFQKLSRDIHIKEFRLSKRDSNQGSKELDILDEEGRPILNMFSDGQLSVFMMSYFLGNAFRLADKEKMSIYMMDDVTSCMDDINMLAFLDLIKYQLKTENGAFSQLFFSSCNERIHNLLEWKANGCGIKCKRIVLNEVQN